MIRLLFILWFLVLISCTHIKVLTKVRVCVCECVCVRVCESVQAAITEFQRLDVL